jgi:phage-related protein
MSEAGYSRKGRKGLKKKQERWGLAGKAKQQSQLSVTHFLAVNCRLKILLLF